ncbi:MAG: hypothetical protein JNJ83_00835 [Verrucomicrobiaceae bacterium]|nr:hypothetical protein [Verrucomicrobiaceae bacterium]
MIWILTAGFGDGHNAAARGIRDAWSRQQPKVPVVMEDWLLRQKPLLSGLSMAAYREVIVHCPALWRLAYRRLEKRPEEALHPLLLELLRGPLEDDLVRFRPKAIVSTYPLYSSLLDALRQDGFPVPPLLTVVTDALSIHPTWVFSPSDRYAVIESKSAAELVRQGVEGSKISVTGFPVRLDYLEPKPARPSSPGVLYLPSTPGSHVEETLGELDRSLPQGTRLTVVMGRHDRRLYHRMRRFVDNCSHVRLDVHGWTEQVPVLMRQHDLVITKAGGAIVHEVMAAAVPAIIDCVVPGQEEGNAQEIVDAGGAALSKSPQETAKLAAQWLSGPGQLQLMLTALAKVSRPDAALRVVDEVLRMI